MNRKLIGFFFFSLVIHFLWAQNEGNTIIVGSECARIKFNANNTFGINYRTKNENALATLTSISNSNGNLVLFSNGNVVYNADGDTIENGYHLQDSLVGNAYRYGMPFPQGALILPKGNGQYYLIYFSDSDPNFLAQTALDRLYYAVVDMHLNNGKGKVIEKKKLLCNIPIGVNRLTACQHANGRDWWLSYHGYNNNRFYTHLVGPDSISPYTTQDIGAGSGPNESGGEAAFSKDGNRYACVTISSPLTILDFDRCTGLFSNPINIPIEMDTLDYNPPIQLAGGGGNGLCFSPNGRFVYLNTIYFLNQYDLDSIGTPAQRKRIFFSDYQTDFYGLMQAHNTPDNRILIVNYQGGYGAFHVIDSPDLPGLRCTFRKSGFYVQNLNNISISNMPHFGLGAVQGSDCDTLIAGLPSAEGTSNGMGIFPNPVKDFYGKTKFF